MAKSRGSTRASGRSGGSARAGTPPTLDQRVSSLLSDISSATDRTALNVLQRRADSLIAEAIRDPSRAMRQSTVTLNRIGRALATARRTIGGQ